MTTKPKRYDGTVARIAGNILSGLASTTPLADIGNLQVALAVSIARDIVAETKRTEPDPDLET